MVFSDVEKEILAFLKRNEAGVKISNLAVELRLPVDMTRSRVDRLVRKRLVCRLVGERRGLTRYKLVEHSKIKEFVPCINGLLAH